MWSIKTFKTEAEMDAFLDKWDGRIQWQYIYVNNAYGIQWRKLRRVY